MATIVGMGAVSAAGIGLAALDAAMEEGKPCVRPVARFSTAPFAVHTAALVPGFDEPTLSPGLDGQPARLALAFALAAGREALAQAGPAPGRTALVVGTNLEDRPEPLDRLLAEIARGLDIDGPRLLSCLACASGTAALGHALALLDRGDAERVVVGGVDVITPRVFAGFFTLGALAPEAAAPFSEPAGMTLGDGAGFLVLQRGGGGMAVLGCGLAGDAFHPTRPAPDGRGVAGATRRALAAAGLAPQDIDYVNAHGTGTEANDAAEWLGLSSVLSRPDSAPLPVSSSKGLIGHAQGAAGILEIIVTLRAAAADRIPPTWGFRGPRPGAPPDPVPEVRPGRIETFVSSNAGFGGCNAVAVIGPARLAARRVREVRPIWIAGVGVAGLADGSDAPTLPRGVDPDTLDPAGRWLCAAVGAALASARIRLDRSMRPRTGLVVGQQAVSASVTRAMEEAVDRDGLTAITAALFSRALMNAPAGGCAAALGLQGPVDVVTAGPVSGLAAVVRAAEILATDRSVDRMLVASVDDRNERCELAGSVAFVLSTEPGPSGVRLCSWSLGPPSEEGDDEPCAVAMLSLADAVERSLEGEITSRAPRTLSCRLALGR